MFTIGKDVIYTVYSTAPFSQKNHGKMLDQAWSRAGAAERLDSTKSFLPCGICGRPVETTKAKTWGIVIDGGASWGTPEDPEDPGHMGAFPVGPDCHRKFKP